MDDTELYRILYQGGSPAEEIPKLARVIELLRDRVLRRQNRGSGSVLSLYARTLAGAGEAAFLDGFLRSAAFAACSEVGGGTCIEEAVYRYCVDTCIGEPEVREDEFLSAIMRALAVNPRPDFTVPVRRRGRGWAEVRGAVLYAAVDGRFVRGEVPSAVVRAIDAGSVEAARAAGVPEAVVRRVEAMGLLAPQRTSIAAPSTV